MQFSIEILNVSKSQQPTKTGKMMDVIELAFKKDGKVEGKKLFPAFAKDVCKKLESAKSGETYTVTAEKEGDFWQWKEVTQGGGSSSQASASASGGSTTSASTKSPVKGDWETREERAARQVMIVKQSSLSNAVATLATSKSPADPDAVLALAQRYTDWVLATPTTQPAAAKQDPFADMDDDIPL